NPGLTAWSESTARGSRFAIAGTLRCRAGRNCLNGSATKNLFRDAIVANWLAPSWRARCDRSTQVLPCAERPARHADRPGTATKLNRRRESGKNRGWRMAKKPKSKKPQSNKATKNTSATAEPKGKII